MPHRNGASEYRRRSDCRASKGRSRTRKRRRRDGSNASALHIFLEQSALTRRRYELATKCSGARLQRARAPSHHEVARRGIWARHHREKDPGPAQNIPSSGKERTHPWSCSTADFRKRPSYGSGGGTAPARRQEEAPGTDHDGIATRVGGCTACTGQGRSRVEQALEAFWKTLNLSDGQAAPWAPKPELLVFLASL